MRSEADGKLIISEIATTLTNCISAERKYALRSREGHEVNIRVRDRDLLRPLGIELRILINLCIVSAKELSPADTDIRNRMIGTGLQSTETQFGSGLIQRDITGLRIARSYHIIIYFVPIPETVTIDILLYDKSRIGRTPPRTGIFLSVFSGKGQDSRNTGKVKILLFLAAVKRKRTL